MSVETFTSALKRFGQVAGEELKENGLADFSAVGAGGATKFGILSALTSTSTMGADDPVRFGLGLAASLVASVLVAGAARISIKSWQKSHRESAPDEIATEGKKELKSTFTTELSNALEGFTLIPASISQSTIDNATGEKRSFKDHTKRGAIGGVLGTARHGLDAVVPGTDLLSNTVAIFLDIAKNMSESVINKAADAGILPETNTNPQLAEVLAQAKDDIIILPAPTPDAVKALPAPSVAEQIIQAHDVEQVTSEPATHLESLVARDREASLNPTASPAH